MKLYFDKRLKDPAYYGQVAIRNGKKVSSKNVINFGKHSELLKITDDPEAYVREKIRQWNEEHRVGRENTPFTADFNMRVHRSGETVPPSALFNIGYFFLQETMSGLQLKEFFQDKTKDSKITFDPYTVMRFLTYARILDPMSKYATWDKLDTYYEKPDFAYQHILRFMDILAKHDKEYLAWLFHHSNSIMDRDTSILYYDCTNFYFEIEQADEDVIDEVSGELVRGLRQYGISKEHRPNPLVEMGLFMDKNGIPITMCLHPGNTSEQLTAIPLEEEILKMIPGARFIYCADAGLSSYNIRKFNSMGGRAFIVTQSIKKMSEPLKQAVFNDYDYRLLSSDTPVSLETMKTFDRNNKDNLNLYNDLAYKVIEADKTVDLGLYETVVLKNGRTVRRKSKGLLKQRVIITFSRKEMEYQRAVRNHQVERARILLRQKDPEEIKKGPNDVRRFLKRETADGKDSVKYVLDEKKIAEEERYDGFYAVATNLDDPAKYILEVASKRYQIENCFRILKSNLDGRPVNHRLPNRIRAHFLICYTALLVVRLLEARLRDQGTPVTTGNLIKTLKNLNVMNSHDVEYISVYQGGDILYDLTRLTMLPLDRQYYKPKQLNQLIKKYLK